MNAAKDSFGDDNGTDDLDRLLAYLAAASPPQRIEYRDRVLAFGIDCVAPLMTGRHSAGTRLVRPRVAGGT
jgi:hypothetical protein